MKGAELFLGIDVSKAHLDVGLSSEGGVRRFEHGPEGTGELVTWLGPRKPSLVVLEATGGLETPGATALVNGRRRYS